MEPDGKDTMIEEIDKELRVINVKLKKTLSKTEAVLKECTNETEETEESQNEKTD